MTTFHVRNTILWNFKQIVPTRIQFLSSNDGKMKLNFSSGAKILQFDMVFMSRNQQKRRQLCNDQNLHTLKNFRCENVCIHLFCTTSK